MPAFSTLASFDGNDGSNPVGKLVADSGGDLFGVTSAGGANDDGVVFEIAKTASGYDTTPTVVADLGGPVGVTPNAGLVIDAAGDLFGATTSGGADDAGTIFEVTKSNGSYENTPTILVTSAKNGTLTPINGLVEDSSGNLFGTSADGLLELPRSGASYATEPTLLASFADLPTISTFDVSGNLYGTKTTDLGFGSFSQNIFELVRSESNYTESFLSQISGGFHAGGGPHIEVGNLVVDQSGDVFGTYQGYTLTPDPLNPYTYNGYVFEIANTPSGLANTATTLATFDGTVSALSEDSAGNLFTVWDDESYEIVKGVTGYDSTPKNLSIFSQIDSSGPVGAVGAALIALGSGAEVFGSTAGGGVSDEGSVYELNFATAPTLTINSTVGQTDPDQQTISGTIDLADVGEQVSIYDGSTLVGKATPASNGGWSATVTLFGTTTSQSITAQAINTTNGADATGTSGAIVYALNSATPPTLSHLTLTTGGGVTVGSGNGDVKLFDLSGNDTLQGGSGNEALHVATGNNSMVAGSGLNTLFGGAGDDTLIGGGQSRLIGGSGFQRLMGGGTPAAGDTLIGGAGTNTLSVVAGSNMLIAGSGGSTLRGGSGQDTLKGGSGSLALLIAGSGSQRLVGSTLIGSSDTLRGGAGADTLVSVNGDDRLIAGSGYQTLRGGSGADTIVAGAGRDIISGGPGDDHFVLGAGGQAVVYAGSGNNKVLVGGVGNDSIFGGSGVTNVYSSQPVSQVSNEYVNAAQYLEVTFTDGQILTLQGVTLHFQDGGVVQS